ncbi:MAG: helix-turn-helix domain-containing protein, partial [Minisyncoccia bacterium]
VESSAWRSLNALPLYLSEQHRQEDAEYRRILENIRAGTIDHADISRILSREADSEDETLHDMPQLYTHNADVDRLNAERLAALPGTSMHYAMETTGRGPLVESLKRGCLSPESLELKEGAVVMATKNNPSAGYVNGTLGTIVEFERGTGYPILQTKEGRSIPIAPAEWAIEEGGKVRAKISQTPLRLAWAVTIHKSQGASMDKAAIDLSKAFEYGQGYVALSRLRSLKGLTLLGWSEDALRIHPTVFKEDGQLRASSKAAAASFAALRETGERDTLEAAFIRASGGTLEARRGPKLAKRDTYEETLALIEAGESTLTALAKKRSLTSGTIISHIEKLVVDGRLSLKGAQALAPKKVADGLEKIAAAAGTGGLRSLTPTFKKLQGRYTFDDLRFARILLSK